MTPVDGWSDYQKLVLQELEYHHQTLEEMKRELSELRVTLAVLTSHSERISKLETTQRAHEVHIATLNVKAGFWGGLAGILSALATALIYLATK